MIYPKLGVTGKNFFDYAGAVCEEDDMQERPYIERCDMDISELLRDSEANEFENPQKETDPGESFGVTYEDTLPIVSCWIPEAKTCFLSDPICRDN